MERKDFELLAQKLRPRLLKVGREFFGNAEDAEDVAQETLLRLWTARSGIRIDEVEALAVKVARNYCVSVWRKQKLEELPVDTLPDLPHRETPADTIQETENRRLLAKAVEQLTAAQRRILQMRAETGLKTAEMAQILGIKPESVSAMLSAARHTLYQTLRKLTER